MRKINNRNVLANLFGAVAASMVLVSCASKPPVQTTNVTVTVPSPTEGAAKPDSVARDESGAAPEKPVVEIDENPEPDAPAPKSASKPAPKAANKAATAPAEKSQLLDFYDRLPAKHFAMFQNGDRRALLKRKGVIIDYKHNFIEIPGSADARDGDLRALQMTLFPNGKEPWCAVSRIVWPQDSTPGTLDFYYGSSDSGSLRKAAEGFFPYNLEKSDIGFRSAWLPRRGLNIIVSTVDDPMSGNIYHYNRDFRVGQAAFYPVDHYED